MRIALAQINSTLGDFASNRKKILEYCERAVEKHCDLVVFPELALFGYLPADLLERESVVHEQVKELEKLSREIPENIGVLVGAVTYNLASTKKRASGKPFRNSAVFLTKGKKARHFHKELLPSYDIFDETRYFQSGNVTRNTLRFRGKKILVTVCEDMWGWGQKWPGANYPENPLKKIKPRAHDLVINISASPFSKHQHKNRLKNAAHTVSSLKAPLIYVNMVGAQDEVIFDGGSFAMDPRGKVLAQSVRFEEDLNVVDLVKNEGGVRKISAQPAEDLHRALVLGIRDFVTKNGFQKVHLGLSGGIDSAVVVALAADAIGPQRVTAIALPGPFSSPDSLRLAEISAKNLGIAFKKVGISKAYETLVSGLEEGLGRMEFGVVHENLQARLRGMILMAYSNKEHSLLLTTGNKSEYASGYCTLYGDMCGGLAPIADLLKGEVYALAEYFNREFELIPREIFLRPPTAELRPGQKDQDTLPPYDVLDRAVERLVVEARSPASDEEKWLLRALMRSEFKRWQAPPVLRVSSHAFGKGRRLPITNKALF